MSHPNDKRRAFPCLVAISAFSSLQGRGLRSKLASNESRCHWLNWTRGILNVQ